MVNSRKYKMVIITPFYPINHRNDLFEDTKAVHYLLKEFTQEHKILIIHLFMHGFRSAWKNITKVLPIKSLYNDHLKIDDYGNSVLFFEYLLLIPKSIKAFKYFNKKYTYLIEQYCRNKEYNPDVAVVHFPTYYVNLLSQIEIFPKTIAVIHAFDIKNIKSRENHYFWQKYFETYDAIGFRSYVIKKEFEEIIGHCNKTFMCLSGIPETYILQEINQIPYYITDNINLIFAGRLDDNKNVAKSILALNKLDKKIGYSFTIVGEGEEKKNISRLARNLGIDNKINFTGKVSREKTFELMKNADVFIMVSKKETLGLVYLEAMAAGCIIIGTRGQGIDGIVINGENGFLADSDNVESIYRTISHVMNLSPIEQNRIRNNAKETVKSLSDTALSLNYFSNICSVIEEEQ